MADRTPENSREAAPWPLAVRVVLLTVLFAVFGVGLVFLLYDGGLLPLAGPFVAMALAPVFGVLGLLWLARRHRNLGRRAVSELSALIPQLERERGLPRDQRSSGATDETLDAALRRARMGQSRFAFGDEEAGVEHVESLARIARPWAEAAPVTTATGRVVETAQKCRKSQDRLRRRRDTASSP